MNKTQVVTLRMSLHLKRRLQREANYQGVSLNQLTNYPLEDMKTPSHLIKPSQTFLTLRKAIPSIYLVVLKTIIIFQEILMEVNSRFSMVRNY